jgi:type I restriction enzyme, S subunit
VSKENGKALPTGWTIAAIEDLFWPLEDRRTLHQGWSPQCEKTPAPTDEDWGVLKTTAIQAGAFFDEHNKQLPKHLEPRPQIEVKAGDILLTCAGPRVRCGVACLVRNTRPRLMMSGKMYRFRVSPDYFDARFLEAYLLTPEATSAIDKMKTGGSDSGLNLTHDRFRPLPVPVAPLGEQRRIMDMVEELFSDLDAGVAALERVRAKLKHYRAAVLKAAVDGALTAEWRREHPATEPASALLTRILAERRRRWEEAQLQKFQAAGKTPPKDWKARYPEPTLSDTANLPLLPESWCWVSADQLAWSSGYGTSEKCSETNAGLTVLRIPNIIGGRLNLSDLKFARPSYAERPDELVKCGDILVVRTNGSRTLIGRGAVVREEPERPLSFASYLIRLRLVPSSSLLGWIALLWESPAVRLWIEKRAATSAGQHNISLSVLKSLVVPLPPEREQATIVEAVENQLSMIEHLEADLETKLKSAQALRQSILRDAFAGKLVPQDANDEPASELVKRIAAEREERARQIKPVKKTAMRRKTTLP